MDDDVEYAVICWRCSFEGTRDDYLESQRCPDCNAPLTLADADR